MYCRWQVFTGIRLGQPNCIRSSPVVVPQVSPLCISMCNTWTLLIQADSQSTVITWCVIIFTVETFILTQVSFCLFYHGCSLNSGASCCSQWLYLGRPHFGSGQIILKFWISFTLVLGWLFHSSVSDWIQNFVSSEPKQSWKTKNNSNVNFERK